MIVLCTLYSAVLPPVVMPSPLFAVGPFFTSIFFSPHQPLYPAGI